ncbi:DUF2219 domain-containing protein [Maritimibacter sp. 55A14]|uniref:lipid A-modifier LpxR family protein n=1 Tax=Maritimibacter sp. 55A14 TaxID=2174844 RepID=UPI000D618953|nr:lipid A-modifier LpxR family protein [Maritimibacter sp. 55A14]PWE29440.1 DUF2219 domain-containing protein [Maritimibacter sp. 55A14]
MIRTSAAALAFLVAALPATAGERMNLGIGTIFDNDAMGDGDDRWRSGSFAISHFRGPEWRGKLPEAPGSFIEWRFRSEIITPENVSGTAITSDRRYVGVLSAGLHTHFQRNGAEVSLGADIVAIGPQTGLDDFQDAVHDLIGTSEPRSAVNQIGNDIVPTVTLEVGRELALAGNGHVRFRPFVEAQAGIETLVRIGGDFTFGGTGMGAFRMRDVVTGQRIDGVIGTADTGLSFLVGGDIAYVADSFYLPSRLGFDLTETRNRLRAGLQYDGEIASVFYGVTWLGEEFEAQPESQVVGTIAINLNF